MPKNTAVVNVDLTPDCRKTDLRSKTRASLVVVKDLFNIMIIIFCLLANATNSKAVWVSSKGEGKDYECMYEGSGKMRLLLFLSGASVLLTMSVVLELICFGLLSNKLWLQSLEKPNYPTDQTLLLRAFTTTWFAYIAEGFFLMDGLVNASEYLRNRPAPRTDCPVIQWHLFFAVGCCAFATVWMDVLPYLTVQEEDLEQRRTRRTPALYSWPSDILPVARENTVARDEYRDLDPVTESRSVFLNFLCGGLGKAKRAQQEELHHLKNPRMSQNTSVTQADITLDHRETDLGSNSIRSLSVVKIQFDIAILMFCLLANSVWVSSKGEGKDRHDDYECMNNGSGKMRLTLVLLSVAFVMLIMSSLLELIHLGALAYMLRLPQRSLKKPDYGTNPNWLLGFFIATMFCHMVEGCVLMVSLRTGSEYLKNWPTLRTDCPVIHPVFFSEAAGFAFATVCADAGLFFSASDMIDVLQEYLEQRRTRDTPALYSLPRNISTVARENPMTTG